MKRFLYFLFSIFVTIVLNAQVYTFEDDELQRGWVSRPYYRYEAEPEWCRSNGVFLEPSDNQRTLQSEASHQVAVQLASKGDYVEWTIDKSARGINIRFSLPDSGDGVGTEGKFTLQVLNGNSQIFTQDFTLSSYWAWQYTERGGTYPDNTPAENKLTRMKFDEKHFLLQQQVPAGSTLRIAKADDAAAVYTIDFMELEAVEPAKGRADYPQYTDNIVEYNPATDGDIGSFINRNGGKTIFIPVGRFETDRRIYLNTDNTKLIGAGEWWTEIYFNASSNNASTYSSRGIEGSRNNLLVEGLSLNTINNKRYYQNNDSKQVGKGFQGGFGTGSVIRNCWVEHFECGAWIADYSGNNSKKLLVENCRFRNNYADGINLCKGSTNHVVRNCSFRNNGDDDMASWSTGNLCSGCIFEYCTAENNWRASSLAFFGGQDQTAHHIAIYDAIEGAVRATCDFAGTGFKTVGRILFSDISIHHSGCKSGTWGQDGDFWGNMAGALSLTSSANYDINNVEVKNINIYNSRTHAIWLRSVTGRKLNNIVLENIRVENADGYGIFYSGAQGTARYCNLELNGCTRGEQSPHMPTFEIDENCGENGLESVTISADVPTAHLILSDGHLSISTDEGMFTLTGIRLK